MKIFFAHCPRPSTAGTVSTRVRAQTFCETLMLPPLQLLQPTTVSEASRALEEFGDDAKIYAGGAELLLLMRHGLLHTAVLVDVKKIEQLQSLSWDENALRVGACVTHHALETSALVREHAPLFAYAESQVANVRVRNQGTLGGNLCFNDPHSDPGPVLLIHDASVALGGHRGERRMRLDDFFLDMYATALERDEILLEVQIPALPAGMTSAYLRLHRYQRPTLGVAVAVTMERGTVAQARIAVGCVGPKAQRLPQIEAKVAGTTISEAGKLLHEQKPYLHETLRPVDDLLGSADYKLYMTCALLGDALEQALRNNGGEDR
ncbi:MAG: FAD binding domain-containing protein [Candidatus Binatia bacterium]